TLDVAGDLVGPEPVRGPAPDRQLLRAVGTDDLADEPRLDAGDGSARRPCDGRPLDQAVAHAVGLGRVVVVLVVPVDGHALGVDQDLAELGRVGDLGQHGARPVLVAGGVPLERLVSRGRRRARPGNGGRGLPGGLGRRLVVRATRGQGQQRGGGSGDGDDELPHVISSVNGFDRYYGSVARAVRD